MPVKIRSLHVRRFRSAENTQLTKCGGLNVLIGKNNAGKSNLLAAIELTLNHLKSGTIAGFWRTNRPQEEFTDRETAQPVQIGITFDFPPDLNAELRRQLATDAPHLEKAVDQIASHDTISVVVSAALTPRTNIPFLYLSHAGVGELESSGNDLSISGIRLITVKNDVAVDLFDIQRGIFDLRVQIDGISNLISERNRLEYALRERTRSYWITEPLRRSPEIIAEVEQVTKTAATVDDAVVGLRQLVSKKQEAVAEMQRRELRNAMSAFAGDIKTQPAYIEWLMKSMGALKVIYFHEEKPKIGTEEANIFVRMKVRRGGPEQLNAVQQTIRELLGVHVDAFQPDDREGRQPEMDVDQFLVEANGAGIREALRIILDLELKEPDLVLIEEPEVHLHPGLEHVVAEYLRSKSSAIQMFVTTHSTEFVDSVTFQNAYLVSKNSNKRTMTQLVEATEGALRIPRELGLRLSSVFMYDRLVFVEGPSDEAVIRDFARTLNVDLTKWNVGFVHMRGVRNFAHYAAEATLALLSRRQVRMWFVADRDERDDKDVELMMNRLGKNAKLNVLKRRELENYLLDEEATIKFIEQKRRAARLEPRKITKQDVTDAFHAAADTLHGEVIRLRVEAELLAPIFLQTRKNIGDIAGRLEAASEQLKQRRANIQTVSESITEQVTESWAKERLSLAPGSAILERAVDRLGATFSKDRGDSEALASLIAPANVPWEMRSLILDFSAETFEPASEEELITRVEG